MDKLKQYLPHLCVLAAGSLWGGCTGIFNRGIAAYGIELRSVVFFRNMGACLLLGLLFFFYDRSVFRIRLRHLPIFLCSGLVSILLFTFCYFYSQRISPLSTAAILLYTAPTFVVLLSAVIWKDPITRRKLIALVLAFLGCCFAAGIGGGGLGVTRLGLLVGIGSGICYATYSIFGRFALVHYSPLTVTFYTFLVAGIASIFLVRPDNLRIVFDHSGALLSALGLLLLGTVLPYLLYTKGLGDMKDSGKASILASIEPVVASIVGVLVFGEPMTLGVLLGLVCILISVYILR